MLYYIEERKLQVWDLSENLPVPSLEINVGSEFFSEIEPHIVASHDNYLYIYSHHPDQFFLFDISDPKVPVLLGEVLPKSEWTFLAELPTIGEKDSISQINRYIPIVWDPHQYLFNMNEFGFGDFDIKNDRGIVKGSLGVFIGYKKDPKNDTLV